MSSDTIAPMAFQLPDHLARLEDWLRTHRPDYLERLAPPLSTDALAALEQRLGCPLPEEVRALYRWHDGQRDTAWSLVGRFWLLPSAQLEVQRKDLAKDAKEMDEGWWSDAWFPILDDGTGNLVCVDVETGALLMYFHDDPDRDPIASSAAAMFGAIVEGLEAGVLAPATDERWAGSVPSSDDGWTAIRAAHGLSIPLAYAPR